MKYLCVIAFLMLGGVLYSAEKDSECIQELNICRASCYAKPDQDGSCILACYKKADQCTRP